MRKRTFLLKMFFHRRYCTVLVFNFIPRINIYTKSVKCKSQNTNPLFIVEWRRVTPERKKTTKKSLRLASMTSSTTGSTSSYAKPPSIIKRISFNTRRDSWPRRGEKGKRGELGGRRRVWRKNPGIVVSPKRAGWSSRVTSICIAGDPHLANKKGGFSINWRLRIEEDFSFPVWPSLTLAMG